MSLDNIEEIASFIVADGKGILAMKVILPVGKDSIQLELNLLKKIEEIIERCYLDLKV